MNVGLVTTFVIGGIFMMSIFAFNQQMNTTSQEFVLSSINQQQLNGLAEIIINDFNRIGYQTLTSNPFTRIHEDDIIFQADAFDNDSFGPTNVRWYLDTSDPVTSTSNPNDYYLKRRGPVTATTIGTINFAVTHFEVRYYTKNDVETTDPDNVKKIEVEIIVESAEPYRISKNKNSYPRSVWKRVFVPNNINLPY